MSIKNIWETLGLSMEGFVSAIAIVMTISLITTSITLFPHPRESPQTLPLSRHVEWVNVTHGRAYSVTNITFSAGHVAASTKVIVSATRTSNSTCFRCGGSRTETEIETETESPSFSVRDWSVFCPFDVSWNHGSMEQTAVLTRRPEVDIVFVPASCDVPALVWSRDSVTVVQNDWGSPSEPLPEMATTVDCDPTGPGDCTTPCFTNLGLRTCVLRVASPFVVTREAVEWVRLADMNGNSITLDVAAATSPRVTIDGVSMNTRRFDGGVFAGPEGNIEVGLAQHAFVRTVVGVRPPSGGLVIFDARNMVAFLSDAVTDWITALTYCMMVAYVKTMDPSAKRGVVVLALTTALTVTTATQLALFDRLKARSSEILVDNGRVVRFVIVANVAALLVVLFVAWTSVGSSFNHSSLTQLIRVVTFENMLSIAVFGLGPDASVCAIVLVSICLELQTGTDHDESVDADTIVFKHTTPGFISAVVSAAVKFTVAFTFAGVVIDQITDGDELCPVIGLILAFHLAIKRRFM